MAETGQGAWTRSDAQKKLVKDLVLSEQAKPNGARTATQHADEAIKQLGFDKQFRNAIRCWINAQERKQESAKKCEKTDPVRRSERPTKRSQAVTDAIDDELQSGERAKEYERQTRAERRAAEVPPVEVSTMGYAGVYWDRKRQWKACYKPAKGARWKYLGSYATDQLAARAL